jgi:hypothetical protein
VLVTAGGGFTGAWQEASKKAARNKTAEIFLVMIDPFLLGCCNFTVICPGKRQL